MEYKVFTKSVELSEANKNYLAKRMSKPDHLLKKQKDLVSPADVRITKERGIYKVEITTHVKALSKIIKVEERSNDLYEAIDRATDALERKIREIKTRLHPKQQSSKGAIPVNPRETTTTTRIEEAEFEEEEEILEKPTPPKIARIKHHDLTVMNVEEAILQMQLLGHSFFVFRDSTNDAVSVLYERKDGDLGLLVFNE
ncbi:MAG TPA: ribosome-associated translation inhibitor RaiA [Defluviitoga sp.]|nr:ribosome-associated translation inhibitor RaiA [Defluviitoga sp.]HOP25031.1 ribosome-associated translation inhibitor RaiA [Defluviitoga sp.]HPZ29183.1 ribosome-associated translation inhibitor RaiA [Defluviitoga sp.]HQD63090.1 ribosome-associated translation inhibitor RaiA [Defluviitoga sp.]